MSKPLGGSSPPPTCCGEGDSMASRSSQGLAGEPRGLWGARGSPAYIAVPCPPSPSGLAGTRATEDERGPVLPEKGRALGPIGRRSRGRVHRRGAGFYTRTAKWDYRFPHRPVPGPFRSVLWSAE